MIKDILILILGIVLGAGTVYLLVTKDASDSRTAEQGSIATADVQTVSEISSFSSDDFKEHVNSKDETLDEVNDSKLKKDFESNNKALTFNSVVGFNSTSAKVVTIDLKKEFERQEVDYDWAPSKELAIREIVDKNIVGENAWIVNSECRTNLCKLDLGIMSGSSELISKTLSILSESELDLEGSSYSLTKLENNSGYFDVTIFYNKPEQLVND